MRIYQQSIKLPAKRRGFHIITDEIERVVARSHIQTGLANIFLKHTSASLSINENADRSVREDFESFFSDIADSKPYYIHTYEGEDDMPGHIKNALLGTSLTIPITNGKLNLGTWQGIYLGEHREYGGSREIVITIQGE
ncbi:FIG004064: hypothetical protein [hydrothermal vent metagenome]|uniref:Uncharacterized protein n=1 Tax=hydrothermal vent metagenome TaxID=652676 RepID=A0A1W1BEZ9_9ZZZZ